MPEPVRIDITHKTKRYQQDIETKSVQEPGGEKNEIIPINVTLESAITFYEKYAEGVYELLYKKTASWLKMLFNNIFANTGSVGVNDAVKQFIANRESVKDNERTNEED